MNNDGYIHFKNVIDKKYIDYAKSCITDEKVHYTGVEKFIYGSMFDFLDSQGIELNMAKYRVSNNNNSVDAAGFHRDLQVHNNSITESVPIYTVLAYLDEGSIMELIPGSHVQYRMNILDSIKTYNKRISLNIDPGDILIFQATMIHKGIFFNTGKDRRLIQCFDCFGDGVDYTSKILHLPCIDQCSSTFEKNAMYISKIKNLVNCLDFVNYFNVASGYNCKSNFLKEKFYKNIDFLSSESNNKRLIPKEDEYDTINKYIIKNPNIIDQTPEDVSAIYFFTTKIFYIKIFSILFLILILIFIKKNSLKK